MTGIRVTCEDLETGETESRVIEGNEVLVMVFGTARVAHVNRFPTTGTQVYTIKGLDNA